MECYYFEEKRLARQIFDISVPVSLVPQVRAGEVRVLGFGEPVLRRGRCGRCGRARAVLTQNIRIEIPLEFSADARLGEACIQNIQRS
ncbi:MAG: hypothetical protein FWF10_08680 [Clostridiales bacterium]|nr:hypothetical protein [Clostridiales bacterium]